MQGLQLGSMQCISDRRTTGQVAIKRLDQPNGIPVAHLPLGCHDRPSPGLEEWCGETLHALALEDDAAGRATGREHDQIGIEVQRCQLGRPHQTTLTPAG